MIHYKALAIALFVFFLHDARAQQDVTAEMNKVRLTFNVDREGTPVYSLSYAGKPVIKPSRMGFKLDKDSVFYKGFEVIGLDKTTADNTWQPVWGEVGHIRDHYTQLVAHLQQRGGARRRMDIVFRVFEDGVGFRFVFLLVSLLGFFVV